MKRFLIALCMVSPACLAEEVEKVPQSLRDAYNRGGIQGQICFDDSGYCEPLGTESIRKNPPPTTGTGSATLEVVLTAIRNTYGASANVRITYKQSSNGTIEWTVDVQIAVGSAVGTGGFEESVGKSHR